MSAATSVSGSIEPLSSGGEHTMILFTPAIFAGSVDITAELGYLAPPPGT